MFSRPHTCVSESYVDMAVALDRIRTVETYADFLSTLNSEIAEVYGPDVAVDEERILYSNSSDPKSAYLNAFNKRLFELIKFYDDAKLTAVTLRTEYDSMLAARPVPVKPEPKFDENGEELPPPPKSKKALREEAEQKKKDTEQLRNVLTAEHKAECASIKLKNAFDLKALRVGINRLRR